MAVPIAHKPSTMDRAANQKKALQDHLDAEAKSQRDIEAEIRRQKELLRGLLGEAAD